MLQLDSHPALLIIDMQNAFCHPHGSFAKMGIPCESTTTIIPQINTLRSAFRSAHLPIIFLRTGYHTDYSDRRRRDARDSIEKLQGLIRGTWDAAILDELTPEEDPPEEIVLEKTRNSGFCRTELEEVLRGRGINHLVLTGVGTDVCVESTAREGYQLDFAVTTVRDATGTCNVPDHLAALHALRMFGGTASTVEVVEALRRLPDDSIRN